MKKKVELLSIITIIICLIFVINNTLLINKYIIYATKLWLYKVFPFLFTMIIINELLINNNIIYYITKTLKKRGIKVYVLLMCILSGSPTNAYIIKRLYNNKTISLTESNKLLYCTYFSNPIFLISMLSSIFNYKTAIMLIIIHYIPNIIMSFFIKIDSNNITVNETNSFNDIINKAINTSLMVLGTLSFYILLSNILINILNINGINNVLIKGIIEVTQGLNEIDSLLINNKFKVILATIFINFGGLSIHSQIKSIIADTSINYKYFLFGRLIQTLISLLLIMYF